MTCGYGSCRARRTRPIDLRIRRSWSISSLIREPGAAFTRRGNISPPRDPSRVPRSFGRALLARATLTLIGPLHGQSILEVLRTRPLTAPAPGSDRRLSGEALHVGGHSHRSDHGQQGSVPGVQRRRPGARSGMRLRRERAHLHAHDLHHVQRNRPRTGAHGKIAGPLAGH
jgi:hypothetical protein